MKKLFLLILGFTFFFACEKESETEKILLTGSSTVAPLMAELAKEFEKNHNNVLVDVQTGGSSKGILDSRNGLNNLGMVSRDLKPEEKDLTPFAVALDGICMIVHKSNPVAELTSGQIVQIYKGEIKNWKNVGGKDLEIAVVNKAEGRSTLELFLKYFKLNSNQIIADVVIGDNEQGIKTVSASPNAIGYVSIGAAEISRDLGSPIKLLPLNGIEPSVKNISNYKYPLMRRLNLVAKEKPTGLSKEFLEFVLSKASYNVIKDMSFVPIQ